MIARADTVRTPGNVLSPVFSLGDLPECIRLLRPWKRFEAGTVFTWSDHGCGFFTEDGNWVVLASTVRSLGAAFFEPLPVQLTFESAVGPSQAQPKITGHAKRDSIGIGEAELMPSHNCSADDMPWKKEGKRNCHDPAHGRRASSTAAPARPTHFRGIHCEKFDRY